MSIASNAVQSVIDCTKEKKKLRIVQYLNYSVYSLLTYKILKAFK